MDFVAPRNKSKRAEPEIRRNSHLGDMALIDHDHRDVTEKKKSEKVVFHIQ